MKTNQEIFDTVATHLLTQQRRATVANGTCRFRTDDGLKCAVGCLIPDDVYKPEFENWSLMTLLDPVTYLSEHLPEGLAACGLGPEHLGLLSALQLMHDNTETKTWPRTLMILAVALNLSQHILITLPASIA